ncbi:hypothetical protein COCON_G00186670 [Conger conger]|uniref:Uncharacterized protein n=1 Tax=Conger conger TaxID=82655 RepID=A0A9Q1D2U4_CONCO|nr:hypothetical protein COCON_G00186670 [Conger conger]
MQGCVTSCNQGGSFLPHCDLTRFLCSFPKRPGWDKKLRTAPLDKNRKKPRGYLRGKSVFFPDCCVNIQPP